MADTFKLEHEKSIGNEQYKRLRFLIVFCHIILAITLTDSTKPRSEGSAAGVLRTQVLKFLQGLCTLLFPALAIIFIITPNSAYLTNHEPDTEIRHYALDAASLFGLDDSIISQSLKPSLRWHRFLDGAIVLEETAVRPHAHILTNIELSRSRSYVDTTIHCATITRL